MYSSPHEVRLGVVRPPPRCWRTQFSVLGVVFLGLLWGCSTGTEEGGSDSSVDIQVDAGCPPDAACDDGDPCTDNDICDGGGGCKGKAKGCDDGSDCTTDSCDPISGKCVHDAAKDGVKCDDGSACTDADSCSKGACGGAPVDCDDGDPCTKDLCVSGTRAAPGKGCDHPKKIGVDCNDGDPCTVGDTCLGGKCKPGEPFDCPGDNACQIATCDAKAGGCAITDAANGAACQPGHPCMVDGKCTDGFCVGGFKPCDDGKECTVDSCGSDGKCSFVGGKTVGYACNDNNKCTTGEACEANAACANGDLLKCDDTNDCTIDSCDPAKGCQHKALDGDACDDDDSCTKDEACDAKGACTGGKGICACKSHKDCAKHEDGNLCNGSLKCDIDTNVCAVDPPSVVTCTEAGVCQAPKCIEKSGKCTTETVEKGVGCNDGDACSKLDSCLAGKCVGVTVDCDDKSPCTADTCDAKAGCVYKHVTGGCDAGDGPCTEGDACYSGVCVPGKAKACGDGDPCTVDSCDNKTGNCVFANAQNGTACDSDNDVCTKGDSCVSGKCATGKSVPCGDGNPCTDDACHPTKGCQHVPNGAPCDDNNPCTTDEQCGGAKCGKGKPVDCDDENKCTSNSCDAGSGAKKGLGCVFKKISGCQPDPKKWTVLVYMAADNNLEDAALKDIQEMLQAKAGDTLRFVVQIDRSQGFSSAAISGAGDFTSTKRLVIQTNKAGKRELVHVADLGETDTGDPKHLESFLAWGLATYPADYTALIMWNHGQAWRGIAGDEGGGSAKWLLLPELRAAVKAGLAKGLAKSTKKTKKLSLIGFDACLMGGVVVAKSVHDLADYMIASEDLEPAHGWDYRAFDAVVENEQLGPDLLGKAILDGYLSHAKANKKSTSVTLSLLKLDNALDLDKAVGALTKSMGTDMQKIAKKVGATRSQVMEFGRSPNPEHAYFMVDLGDLANLVAKEAPQLGKQKDDLLNSLKKMVVYKVHGQVTKRATGLAVYFPPTQKLYRKTYADVKEMADWRGTLTGFHGVAKTQGVVPKLQKVASTDGDSKADLGEQVVTLPFIDDFPCGGESAKRWSFTSGFYSSGKGTANWRVGSLLANKEGIGCTAHFVNYPKSNHACADQTGGFLAYAHTPWVSLAGLGESEALVVQTDTLYPPNTHATLRYSFDGKIWRSIKPTSALLQLGPVTATLVPQRRSPKATKIRFRISFSGLCEYVKSDYTGPRIYNFEVHRSSTVCDTRDAGTWCRGATVFTCDSNHQVLARKQCAFGCQTSADVGKDTCVSKVGGLPGEVTVTCDADGVLQVKAKLQEGMAENVAHVQLFYGYQPGRDPGPLLAKTAGFSKPPPSHGRPIIGDTRATVAADGTVTATWNQRLLVAQHPRGRAILYTRHTPADDRDHYEVAVEYSSIFKGACRCLHHSDPGWSDIDKDTWPDCVDVDVDGDTIHNDDDNCVWTVNPKQDDADGDGIGDACVKAGTPAPLLGRPDYTCEPQAFGERRSGVWHIDLEPKTGALIGQTLYIQQPYGVSEFTPGPGVVVRIQEKRVGSASGGRVDASHFTTLLSSAVIEGQDIAGVVFMRPTLEQLPTFLPNGKPWTGGVESNAEGEPVRYVDMHRVRNLHLEMVTESMDGRVDSVTYEGPVPDGCIPKPLPCAANQLRDCLGTCRPKSLLGDGVCQRGKNLGPHFRCAANNYDNGDCERCRDATMIPDCQGRCVPRAHVRALLRNRVCNDGSKAHDLTGRTGAHCMSDDAYCEKSSTPNVTREPDLNCATHSFDGGDCGTPRGLTNDAAERCAQSTMLGDCSGGCVDARRLDSTGPGTRDTCNPRYNCDRFAWDGRNITCTVTKITKKLSCPANCSAHGACVGGVCKCAAGWTGLRCDVPAATNGPCDTSKAPGSANLLIASCTCGIEPACCTKEWSAECVALAGARCGAVCGNGKVCSGKKCPPKGFIDVTVGSRHACFRKGGTDAGRVYCVGRFEDGQAGEVNTSYSDVLLPFNGDGQHVSYTSISAFADVTCGVGVATAKTKALLQCSGRFLKNNKTNAGTPVHQTSTAGDDAVQAPSQVAVGGAHRCVVVQGKVWCSGSNLYGQLAPVAKVDFSGTLKRCLGHHDDLVQTTFNPGVSEVVVGNRHTCVLVPKATPKDKDRVFCAGDHRYQQRGGLNLTEIGTPDGPVQSAVYGVAIQGLRSGGDHNCITYGSLKTVWCWGRNDRGQCGVASGATGSTTLKNVVPLSKVIGLALGNKHTCAINANGTVMCWGDNSHGQLGDHASYQSAKPVLVRTDDSGQPLTNIVKIAAGANTTCAVTKDGQPRCWGEGTWRFGLQSATNACQPDCSDSDCGDNGCGGSCGTCDAASYCFQAKCKACVPQCPQGVECGDDGCGGSCGDCGKGEVCAFPPGQCITTGSATGCAGRCGGAGLTANGQTCGCDTNCSKRKDCCADYDTKCAKCTAECGVKYCGDNGCGGVCGICDGSTCGTSGYCLTNWGCKGRCGKTGYHNSKLCSCAADCAKTGNCCPDVLQHCGTCTPECDGKQCGPDGCGGTCGACDPGRACFANGRCGEQTLCIGRCGSAGEGAASTFLCSCAPDCTFKGDCCPDYCKECSGKSGCSGLCGQLSQRVNGSPCSCREDCLSAPGGCCPDRSSYCGKCKPSCAGKKCGDDGCGGTCGTCDSQSFCSDTDTCEPLDCQGRACGPGAKGGSCGACAVDEVCKQLPGSSGTVCAKSVGCDGNCGTTSLTADGNVCSCLFGCFGKNTCCADIKSFCGTCVPSCKGRECGGDGCGGSCGACPKTANCNNLDGVCRTYGSCKNACGKLMLSLSGGSCSCKPDCKLHGTCCADMAQQCPLSVGCKERCGQTSFDGNGAACSCAFDCGAQGNCCADVWSYCAVCSPKCGAQQCGSDGCGGSCGDCPTGASCANGLCLTDCLPGVCREVCNAASYEVDTFAGSIPGFKDAVGPQARFQFPEAVAFDGQGRAWIADRFNHRIRRINLDGKVTTIAGGVKGYKNGTGSVAKFNEPIGIVYHPKFGIVVADRRNYRLRKISDAGVVSWFSGNGVNGNNPSKHPEKVSFGDLAGMAASPKEDAIYHAEPGFHRLRRTQPNGKTQPLGLSSGGHRDGVELVALLNRPTDVTVNSHGIVFVADTGNRAIRRYDPFTKQITTLYGGPTNQDNLLLSPRGIAATARGDLLVVDDLNHSVFAVRADASVRLVAGGIAGHANGNGLGARFRNPWAIAIGTQGTALILENSSGRVRSMQVPSGCDDGNPCTADSCTGLSGRCRHLQVVGCAAPTGTVCKAQNWSVHTVAGSVQGLADGPLSKAQFSGPAAVEILPSGALLVVDYASHRIRKIETDGLVTTWAGSVAGYQHGNGTKARFFHPMGLSMRSGRGALVADYANRRIRTVSDSPYRTVNTLAGNGAYSATNGVRFKASFKAPRDVVWLKGERALVTDESACQLRLIDTTPGAKYGTVTTFAGSSPGHADGKGSAAKFNFPSRLAVGSDEVIYVSEWNNSRIRRVTKDGVVTTFAGSGVGGISDGPGAVAKFRRPIGIAATKAGLYVSDSAGDLIRLIDYEGNVTTIAGADGKASFADGPGAAARFSAPLGLAADDKGNIFVADTGNHRIRHIRRDTTCDDGEPCTVDYCDVAEGKSTGTCRRDPIDGCGREDGKTACVQDTYIVTRMAGGNGAGSVDGSKAVAKLNRPVSVAVEKSGSLLVATHNGHRIRRVAKDGGITTVAGWQYGYAEGPVKTAKFRALADVVPHPLLGMVISDWGNHRIRYLKDGKVNLLVGDGKLARKDGKGAQASIGQPRGLALASNGDIWVGANHSYSIRRIKVDGNITTIAGGTYGFADGKGTLARFSYVNRLVAHSQGHLYVADYLNGRLRKVEADGTVTTVAGNGLEIAGINGPALSVKLPQPIGLVDDGHGGLLVFTNKGHDVRRLYYSGSNAFLKQVAGGSQGNNDGVGLAAQFNGPQGAALHGDTVYLAEAEGHRIRTIKVSQTCANDDPCTAERCSPSDICETSSVDSCKHPKTNTTYCSPTSWPVSKLSNNNGKPSLYVDQPVSMLASGTSLYLFNAGWTFAFVSRQSSSGVWAGLAGGFRGFADGKGTAAKFGGASDIKEHAKWGIVIADQHNHCIRKLTTAGTVTTIAGIGTKCGESNGAAASATFCGPSGIAFQSDGSMLVTDSWNNKIRHIGLDGKVTNWAGSGEIGFKDGPESEARFHRPLQPVVDKLGHAYVLDRHNFAIRKISTVSGKRTVTTIAGGVRGAADGEGSTAQFLDMAGLLDDEMGSLLVAEGLGHRIRRVTKTGVVTTIAGSAAGRRNAVLGLHALFNEPGPMIRKSAGEVYVLDKGNHGIRKLGISATCADGDKCTLDDCSGLPATCKHTDLCKTK